jgi:geranylgeranyl reductase
MLMKYDVVIVGGGPGGLHCGRILAENGVRVLILERNRVIGKKVCAGGITWKGLIGRVPPELLERSFLSQNIRTIRQNVRISSQNPIVGTLNRIKLGRFMAEKAMADGAEIISGARVTRVADTSITFQRERKAHQVSFDYLVGADGGTSKVRSALGLAVERCGVGINYTVAAPLEDMEWNFDSTAIGSGYTWIFPHADSVSIGGYAGKDTCRVTQLNDYILRWTAAKKIDLSNTQPQAEKISCDYRGWKFGNRFLIGDAAGLASPLTGEGIFPAFVSAEAAAYTIIDRDHQPRALKLVLEKHRKHAFMQQLADRHSWMAFFLSELSALLLRYRLLPFSAFEMA